MLNALRLFALVVGCSLMAGLSVMAGDKPTVVAYDKIPEKAKIVAVESVEVVKVESKSGPAYKVVVKIAKGTSVDDAARTASHVRWVVTELGGNQMAQTLRDVTISKDGSEASGEVGSIGFIADFDEKTRSGRVVYSGGDLPNLLKLEGLTTGKVTAVYQKQPTDEELKQAKAVAKLLGKTQVTSYEVTLAPKNEKDNEKSKK